MTSLIQQLKKRYPTLTYKASTKYYWSPETAEIFYRKNDAESSDSQWSLLHETGHALLQHQTYKADFELVKLEMAAWEKAKEVAGEFGITIDEDHIQDCLDTYRDWLDKRSICPTCQTKCLQQDDHHHYQCFNCHTVWRVSASRFCRTYRSTKNVPRAETIFI